MSAEFITDIIDVPELIGFVRDQTDGDLPFAGLFPVEQVDDVEFALTQIPAIAGDVAKYRSWDTVPPLGKRPAISIVGGEIPPLGLSYRLNEKEIVQLQKLKAGIEKAAGAQVVDRMFNDGANAGHAIQNRITLGHAEILQTWNVTLTELGDVVSGNAVTTNVTPPSGHVVTPSVVWSTHASAVPEQDLVAWEAKFRRDNGNENPDGWLVSPEVMADLSQCASLRAYFTLGNGSAPNILTPDNVNAALRLAGVKAPVIPTDVQRPALDDSGTGSVLDARKVIATKAGMGKTLYGPTASAALLAGQGVIEFSDAPGIVAFAVNHLLPAAIVTTGEAVAIPIIADPNKLMVATV